MRRRFAFFMLACTLVAFALPVLAETAEKPPLIYFYENYCEMCHPENEFMEEFGGLTSMRLSDYAYTYYNVKNRSAREYYDQVMDEYGVPQDERYLPTVVVDGKVYAGTSKIRQDMPGTFTENGGTDSLIYYLYSPACESCAKAEELLDALPETVEVTLGEYSFESRVVVERINLYERTGAAQALFDRYGVPDSRRITPAIFLRETYYSGAESISRMLDYALGRGEAVGTPLMEKGGAAALSGLTLAGSAMAGLVAGFNPCALSMLLFFLSILLSGSRSPGRYAVAYLVSKFVTYILIGTVFMTALSAWNPTWLPLVAKIMLTVIGGVLCVLNLMDAIAARREKYGEIRNQLPRGVRGFLHGRIKRGLEGRVLLPSVVLLGVIVAASEFMCSGQIYLATLTAGLEAGLAYGQNLLMLAVFCLLFILPSAVLAAVILRGRSVRRMSDGLMRGMPAIKLATSVVMLAIIIAAWLL